MINQNSTIIVVSIIVKLIKLFFIQQSSFISHIVFNSLLEFYLIYNDLINQFYRIYSSMNYSTSTHLQWFNELISVHLQWFNESISIHSQWFNESVLVYLLCSRFTDCTSFISLAFTFEFKRLIWFIFNEYTRFIEHSLDMLFENQSNFIIIMWHQHKSLSKVFALLTLIFKKLKL